MNIESQMILIFGATGDLTRRKLIPSLCHLLQKKRLTSCTPIVCIGRRKMTTESFLELLAPDRYVDNIEKNVLEDLLSRIAYFHFDPASHKTGDFVEGIKGIQQSYGCTSNILIYLALPTTAFLQTAQLIGALNFDKGWRRVVFEKPFGENLASAVQLNRDIHSVLDEEEIYRVDHYLGKQLVQNILTLRFANEIFSGAWRRQAIDHVQITVAETLGVEKRAGYYDRSGAVRDMLQNHLLQLLSFVAMEPPAEVDGDGVRNEAVKVLEHLRPLQPSDIVVGQYGTGSINGENVLAYRQEEGVGDESTTETYVAIRAHVDTDRWLGVPFYLRTGKRLQQRYAEIRIVFKHTANNLVGRCGKPNMIIIRIQPYEGLALAFNVQKPTEQDETESVLMDFCHHCHFGPNTPEAYESILYNVMEGDHSLFPRHDWIEASWEYIDRLRDLAAPPVVYDSGSMGPAEADKLLEADGRKWQNDVVVARQLSPYPRFGL
ncbi:glucose-6-phosphate dehydrogenase [Desulfopila aestuarii]|uniref:Glucose-6-phosphate 1-dehydrogenase n=1 Tax=Desulfopila aestuarii DSM 18488 TaxID=1121416 RepID=A0A1M7XYR7_9BACT|nr:glucose-6-phosphate dehydrogenase [Desulfopila aestuarii]SHO44198.1 glucose-6-phosphate 1-dehydrogenase [Desulfopila aestuarii DSM 18488]